MISDYKGGCACGAVRYEMSGTPIAQLLCQCQHCRQRSGTGHSAYLVFAQRDDLALTGAVKSWSVGENIFWSVRIPRLSGIPIKRHHSGER